MTLRKITWTMLEISAICLFIIFVGYGYLFKIPWLGWGLFFALLGLHVLELKTAFKIGREKGLSDRRILVKTMVFGFTWWVPLRRGLIYK